MNIIRMPIINGITPTLLKGTDRYAYGLSDFENAWDLEDWQENGGYQGSVLYLYDLYENKIYIPFEKRKNVLYQEPLLYNDMIYFLQIDYDNQKINLYHLSSSKPLEKVTDFSISEVNLYNLGLTGEKVHITSQDDSFISYYPERFEIKLEPNEIVICIADGKIYINAWIEEGFENDEITNNYSYYEKILIKDKEGKLLSEEVGSLTQFPDGKWRIS